MSFLYQPSVYDQLIQTLEKTAQNVPMNDVQVAKKLVDKLSRELTGQAEPTNISSDAETPVSLNVNNLQNLGSLLRFLDDNQIRINGQRVAYDMTEASSLPEEERNKLSPVTINVSRDTLSRKWNAADYYTNLPALITYVQHLQQKSVTEGNKILTVMVGKLIDQINQIKPDSGLSRQPKPIPGQVANALPDDTDLDGFGTKLFNAKNPTADRGANTLQAKDLASRENLNAWMMMSPEAQIVVPEGDKFITVKYSDMKADHCVMISCLYQRAQALLRLSKSTEETKKYTYYIKRIQELGSLFTDPTGKSCTVTATYTAPTGSTVPTSYQTGVGPDGKPIDPAAVGVQHNIDQAVASLPFAVRDVNLDRIQRFFAVIEQNPNLARQVSGIIADTEQRMLALKGMMLHADAIYPMGQTPKEFASGLKNQQMPGKQYLAALDRLKEIVSLTRKVVEMFYSFYGNNLSTSAKRSVLGQIGTSRTDNSIAYRNINDIEGLQSGVNQVMRII